jgi:hypothetical protein
MKDRKNRPTPKVTALSAVFAYFSVCCNEQADKPPCSVAKGQHIGTYVGVKPAGESTLGSWRCTKCRKPCKVTRVTKKQEGVNEIIQS